MTSTIKVVKNSTWLISQQLLLNFVSIFVTGYIARKLGQGGYGIFMFVFSYTTLFVPIVNMGISSVMTREIAKNKNDTIDIVNKILPLRIVLALLAYALIVSVISLTHYPVSTKILIYIAGSTTVLSAVNSTLTSGLVGTEKIHYVAIAQFVSGAGITLLSLIFMYLGFGIRSLVLITCFGQFLWLLVTGYYFLKEFKFPSIVIDFNSWLKYLDKGRPFFFPALVSMIGAKIGIVLVSSMAGDRSAGIYGAASSLVEKLVVIPDSIATAIFPAMAFAYQQSSDDAVRLYKNFFSYLLLLGLPIAIGTTLLAKSIIVFIFGIEYLPSIFILQILIWWLFFAFLSILQGSTLAAIHEEKNVANATYISISVYVTLSIVLIAYFKELGAAISNLISGVIAFLIFSYLLKLKLGIYSGLKVNLVNCIVANVIMGISVFLTRKYNIAVPLLTGIVVYIIMIFSLKLISKDELIKLWGMILKTKQN